MSANKFPLNPDGAGALAGANLAVAPVVAAKPLYEAQDQARAMQDVLEAAGAHNADNPHASPIPDVVTNNLDAASAVGAGVATYFGLGLFNKRGNRVESPAARKARLVASFAVGLTVAVAEKYLGMR